MSSVATRNKRRPINEHVLQAALRLFSKRGYFNTSVHDISREAKVSIGAIYHHFGDKEGIAKTMFAAIIERLQAALDDIESRHQGTPERCRAAIALLFEMTEAEPDLMTFMLYAKHREFLPEEKPLCSSAPFERMRNMVKNGMSTGEVRIMDPLVAATSVFGGALRMIHLRLDGLIDKPLPDCLDDVWSCAWRSVST